jgi:hypothetical protein
VVRQYVRVSSAMTAMTTLVAFIEKAFYDIRYDTMIYTHVWARIRIEEVRCEVCYVIVR